MEKKWVVYRHTNKSNGKVYIGITCDVDRRWHNGGAEYLMKSSPFSSAIRKYGWDGFIHEIIIEGLSLDEANAEEKRLIALHKSNVNRYQNPKFGYNQTDGGDGTSGLQRYGDNNSFYNHRHSDMTKEKLRIANTGRFKGKFSCRYGIKLSKEQKQQISQSLQKWYTLHKSHSNKPVYCITDNRWFESATEAELYYEIYRGGVSACCTGSRLSAKGKQFAYSDEGTVRARVTPHDSKEWREKIAATKCIPVICIETGVIYKSAKDASLQIGRSSGSDIGKCCKGKLKSAGGYHWKYKEVANG